MFKRKDILIVLWMSFLTVALWIGLTIYHIWVTSTVSTIDASAIAPIDPQFDMKTINKLKSRQAVEPLYQFNETPAASNEAETTEILPTPTESILPQVTGAP